MFSAAERRTPAAQSALSWIGGFRVSGFGVRWRVLGQGAKVLLDLGKPCPPVLEATAGGGLSDRRKIQAESQSVPRHLATSNQYRANAKPKKTSVLERHAVNSTIRPLRAIPYISASAVFCAVMGAGGRACEALKPQTPRVRRRSNSKHRPKS